jgi:hypothetical protein
MHIICCIRAREKTDFKNPAKPVSLGIQPICEKNFLFEMTASLLMENEGKTQKWLKMPEFLMPTFGKGQSYLGQETGKKLMERMSEGEKEDPAIARAKSEMLMATELGMAGLVAIWNTLTPVMKKKLEAHKNICKESAEEYDRQAKDSQESPQEALRNNIAANGVQAQILMP